MITFYYDISVVSCKQAVQWFEEYKIEINKKRIERISKKDLIRILSLSENGFHDVLKSLNKSGARLTEQVKIIERLGFADAIDFVVSHTNVLRTPIVMDEHKLVIGYNAENMRVFLSREYRDEIK